ncbi:MAG: SRPBCC domain-containing protein, partial [Streptomyces sp.]
HGDGTDEPSQVSFDIEPYEQIVRLTVTHENLKDEAERAEAAQGWAAVLSNLKSYLETGSPLSQQPWLVPTR